jgi:type II secretory pathway pseudopilin PulG
MATTDSTTPPTTPRPSHRTRIWLFTVGGLVVAAVFVFIWWLGPSLFTRHPSQGLKAVDRLKAVNDVRTTLVATLIGLAALGGLIFTALNVRVSQRTLRATQESLENARQAQEDARLAQEETHRLEKETQLTDRYTKAIDQLGSSELAIRLGGIYALERIVIANDSERDHPTIVEVLSSFVRESTRTLSPQRSSEQLKNSHTGHPGHPATHN